MNDLYWLAGILEGEGCFTLEKHSKSNHRGNPRIRIRMTDKDVIVRVSRILCGSDHYTLDTYSRDKCGHKVAYVTGISGKSAVAWMILLYPIMGDRRKFKIREIIGDSYFNGENLKGE